LLSPFIAGVISTFISPFILKVLKGSCDLKKLFIPDLTLKKYFHWRNKICFALEWANTLKNVRIEHKQ